MAILRFHSKHAVSASPKEFRLQNERIHPPETQSVHALQAVSRQVNVEITMAKFPEVPSSAPF